MSQKYSIPIKRRCLGKARSAVSNGRNLFLDPSLTDQRSLAWRHFKDLIADISQDLGGHAQLSTAQQQIVRRASLLATWCEIEELKFIQEGKEINIDLYTRQAASMRRHLEVLGIRRQPKDTGVMLSDYLAQHKAIREAKARANQQR